MDGLTIGRIVHYVFPGPFGDECPATVVGVWQDGLVNLQLFPDSDNEGKNNQRVRLEDRWRTSIKFSENKGPHTWHWPERE